MPPAHTPSDLVFVAWIASIPGFSTAMVDTQLPPDVNADGSEAAWLTSGFVTVAVAGVTAMIVWTVTGTVTVLVVSA